MTGWLQIFIKTSSMLVLVVLLLAACGGLSNGDDPRDESWGNVIPLLTGIDRPFSVVADDTYIYWTEHVIEASVSRISRIPRIGGEPEPLHEQMSGIIALALDDEALYFVDSGSVMRLDKDSLAVSELHPEGNGEGLVVRDGRLYWWNGDADEGRILSVRTNGTDQRLIGFRTGRPDGVIGIDDTRVYWGVSSTGEVLGIELAGESTEPEVLARDQCPRGVAVDDTFVYWHDDESCYLTEGVAVRRAPLSGGSDVETLLERASTIAQGDDGVYLTDGQYLYRATSSSSPSRLGSYADLGCVRNEAVTSCSGTTDLFVDGIGAVLVGWSDSDAGSGWIGVVARP